MAIFDHNYNMDAHPSTNLITRKREAAELSHWLGGRSNKSFLLLNADPNFSPYVQIKIDKALDEFPM